MTPQKEEQVLSRNLKLWHGNTVWVTELEKHTLWEIRDLSGEMLFWFGAKNIKVKEEEI